ncbi:uncharacterized protein BEWA_024770 [Theileria equi strain WA]|uniref:Membrane protein, putative n=1 Tax=Theileria equi strain WA TaxID=1537102 RepID=L0AWJ4_THEEQ|nr:uncharacterized protein BEWA_024770 [Theileria equi strain WA]AFZ79628.1 membrane protein, putative [Theileria equi strain WA]|eukprot:XP_004829294.1 uncharacterized protein BEWA_024770 [Theileria equi strain WA]
MASSTTVKGRADSRYVKLAELSPKLLFLLLLVSNLSLVLAGFVGYSIITRLFGPFSCKEIRSMLFNKAEKKKCIFAEIQARTSHISLTSAWAVLIFFGILFVSSVYINLFVLKHMFKKRSKAE